MERLNILNATDEKFLEGKSDCSKFLKYVAADSRIGIDLPDYQANGLIDYMESNAQWEKLGKGRMDRAIEEALKGRFVVAGAKKEPHGHVAIVVGKDASGMATASWGRRNSIGQLRGRLSLSFDFHNNGQQQVSYYAYRE